MWRSSSSKAIKSTLGNRGWVSLKKGDCPICQGRKKGCSQSADSNLVNCRDVSNNPPGWILQKVSSIGFGLWRSESSTNQNLSAFPNKEEYLKAKKQQQAEAERLERSRVAALLSPSDRQQEIEKLLSQLPLIEADRQSLLAKGLTEGQIDKGGFKSLTRKWQKLSEPINPRLPGVQVNGKGLNNASPGIICPIRSLDGRYLSLRQYNPHHKELGVGKYVYLSSSGRGVTIKDENGELPIALRFPDSYSGMTRIGLCEGLEIKSLLACERLGIPIIAAPGHNLAGSPIALKQAIAQAQAAVGDSAIITIYGDAGAVKNKAVYNDYLKAAKLLTSWGLQVEFAWWGQIEKTVGDIDEIDLAAAEIKYISPASFEQIGEEFLGDRKSIYQELLAQFKGANKRLKRGFDRYFKKGDTPPKKLIYRANVALPSPDEYAEQAPPKIVFKKGDRHKLLADLLEAGWDKVLDRSFMGLGKSHDMGLLANQDESSKVWYLDLNHRNPSVETVENNFDDLPVRHGGLVEDSSRTTPGGQPFQKWAQPGQNADTAALCENAHLFTQLYQKGYQIDDFEGTPKTDEDGENGGANTTTLNPICSKCRFAGSCAISIGEGYGFRFARRKALENPRIRASIDSLPNGSDYSYGNDIAVIEEASQVLKSSKSISAKVGDIDTQLRKLEQFPQLHLLLKPALHKLIPYLEGRERMSRYGLNHQEIVNILGAPPENLEEAIEVVAEENPLIQELVIQADRVQGWGREWKNSQKTANWYLAKEAQQMTAANIDSLPSNFLIHLLLVWGGFAPGALRVDSFRKLSVTIANRRHAEILQQMKATVMLDATGDKDYLAQILGVNTNSIIEIEQELLPLDNFTAVNVHMEGMASNRLSPTCVGRIQKLTSTLKSQHQDLPVLGLKNYGDQIELDGYWFADHRGSNAFKGKRAIAAFGKPMINIGAAEDDYLTLYGSLDGFEAHYQRMIDAEITQFIGRPRAHLFPDEQFVIYLIGDHQLEHLAKYGISVTECEAFEIDASAGSAKQVSQRKMLKAIAGLYNNGEKVNMEKVAAEAGLSPCYIKRLAQGLGGMVALKKWVLNLYDSYRSCTQKFDLDFLLDQQKIKSWMGLNPAEAMREFVQAVEAFGWQDFQLYLQNYSMGNQARMWTWLLPLIFSESEILQLQREIFPPPE